METYELHHLAEDRPHDLSANCWCHPTVLTYGEKLVYDASGELVGTEPVEAEGD